ncbi:MAG TPA: hypothetical protein PLA65_00885 [Spirochaetota bacterium]|nr:hypothetical protein [Spirochaetota bacterium]HOD13447.1 hypothetical protein [Spirochaetota bacterium]HPN10587.1 hypothetical protein [Spirochaetota bacterium]
MKNLFIFTGTCLFFLGIISSGCSVDPDARLNRAIDRFIEKEPGALRDLETDFIRYASVDSIEGEDLKTNGTLLYRLSDGSAKVVYPNRLTLDLTGDGNITQVAADDSYAAITDGIQLGIFSGSGSHLRDESVGDAKSPVRALAIDGDSLLYYRNSRVYRYDVTGNMSTQAYKETFPSPYTSFYNARIEKKGKLLSVLAGIAGSYSFSIVDAGTGSVLLKNLVMSSSRYFMSDKAVYYMAGSSGKWELTRFDLSSKTKKSLARFTDLVDIEPAASGYVCETSEGLWTALYGKDRTRIPFPYELAGSYRGRVLLHYRGAYYFMDMGRLNDGLGRVLDRVPELKPLPSP